ncbi:hypothetical protein PCASD_07218 [Puccinia coronata f. sp. avenae]|uniref:Uncharacterized protein n=1 Tax=Puccinia coronata f. sp. avenae TaxID=200324 RepID=A0A2N5UYP0_9BASI|nr:hypothetical protein PCASD_07218 [Puccinia coronata f. sp. avenae]
MVRVTTRLVAPLGTSAITPIDLDAIPSHASSRANPFVTPPNKRGRSYSLRAQSSPDCEFLDGSGRPIGAITDNSKAPSSPYHITLERFMKIAHIPTYDELAQSHMIVNGIAHWTFFETATEGQLTSMGFPLGSARLLCNAAVAISPLVNENTSKKSGSIYDIPLGVGSHWADMEAYLRMCHILSEDHVTRARLKIHGITHWSFFIKSSEAELLKLGFPLGTSRLLCDGVPEMQAKQAIKKDT